MLKVDKKNFCDVCKNSISMAEAAFKLGMHFNTFTKYAKQFGVYNPNQGLKGGKREKQSEFSLDDILKGKYPHYPTRRVKERLIKEGIKKLICECCYRDTWNDLPIPLELNHIDGNRNNHKLDNLELICPNCHAQTTTYRGKNKSKYKETLT